MLVVGGSAFQFFNSELSRALGFFFIGLSVVTFIMGVISYVKIRRDIYQVSIRKATENKKGMENALEEMWYKKFRIHRWK